MLAINEFFFLNVYENIIDKCIVSLKTDHNRRRFIGGREPCRHESGRGIGGLQNENLCINDYERVLLNNPFETNDSPDMMDFV